jgi:nucleotide-binding universal stress UspA family protein
MKNILLATDLSACAGNASAYAAWLAGVMGARLTMMSAYRAVPVFAGAGSISESSSDRLPELVNGRMEEKAARLGGEYRITVDVLVRTGDPVRAILTAALEIHADLIVVGKTGAGRAVHPASAARDVSRAGLSAAASFGATVVTLARKTPVPLLIVPQGAICTPPRSIAVAKELLTGEVPGALSELLASFGCRLYLFGVKAKTTDEVVEIYQADAIHSTGELYHLLYQIPVGDKLRHSIENFIEVAPIHWLAVRSLPSLAPERWLFGGHSRELAFDVRVPLLIIPEMGKATGRRGSRSS